MKAYTLGRRRSFKDYVDLYVIFLEKIISLGLVISDAKQKYKDAFNDRLFLEQLLYTDDIEDEEILWIMKSRTKEEMKGFFKTIINI